LTNTLKDFSHISELVLIRAVGHDNENTESTSQILDSLSLTSTGWASWGATVHHTQSLGKSDVASVSESSNA